MFLIKEIRIEKVQDDNKVVVKNGIDCFKEYTGKLVPACEFWGETDIMSGTLSEHSLITKSAKDENWVLLTYCNEISATPLTHGWQKLLLNVGPNDEVEGFVIFVPHTKTKIQTTGKVLFSRYYNEGVFLLKNDETLTLDGYTISVIGNKLFVNI